jgi:predicted NAD/FAD-binding protein
MRIAVIGTGISGLVAARNLCREHDVTVFEAADYIGGHTHTVPVQMDGKEWQVDTGFIVYNRRNYPGFSSMLDELGVATKATSMSLSVRCLDQDFEYCGSSLNQLFVQRSNLLSPRFYGMVRDIMRFHRATDDFLASPDPSETMGDFVSRLGLGSAFRDRYLVPIMAAIWSAPPRDTLDFPALFILQFLRNHGMTQVRGRPQWRVVCGGSQSYVEPLIAPFRDRIRLSCRIESLRRSPDGVELRWNGEHSAFFDRVFLATHSDTSLRILGDSATDLERDVLRAIPYQDNEVVLHSDARMLPRRRLAWASWNYRIYPGCSRPASVTYNMSMLQGLETSAPFCVTLNDSDNIAPESILARFRYAHPLFTPDSPAAQAKHRNVNGADRVYFCGAYWGNGFHEDGYGSAIEAVAHFNADRQEVRV